MIDINFRTDKLIIIHYPAGAGGKFIQTALALDEKILFQDEKIARVQMNNSLDFKKRLKIAMWPLKKKKITGHHVEYGCREMAGFNGGNLRENISNDERLGSKFWRDLTNQTKYFFFMVDNFDGKTFYRYPNRKTVQLVNFDWILEARAKKIVGYSRENYLSCNDNITFDMNTLKDSASFLNEIKKIYNHLNLKGPADNNLFEESLNILREEFVKLMTVGFE